MSRRLGTDHPPVQVRKVGFDCTIPPIGQVDRFSYQTATVSEPTPPPSGVKPLAEAATAKEIKAMIDEKPRTSKEIVEHFAGQP